MSDNFDLKKYLVENKATTNSRMLSENVNGLTELLNKIETALNTKSSNFLYVDELRDCVTIILGAYGDRSTWSTIEELEEGLGKSPGYTFVTGYGDDIPNALEINKTADLSLLSNFADEINFLLDNAEEGDEDSMTETKKKHSKMMNEASEEEQHDLFWDLTEETSLEDILAELKVEGGITSEQLVRWIKDNWNSLDDEYEIGTALKVFKDAGITLDHVTGWIESHWYRIGDGTEES